MIATGEKLLEVTDLVKHFPIRAGLLGRVKKHVKAVDGVSFHLRPGETLGLVGESGCGKTTVGRSILRLIEPTSGSVRFRGVELTELPPKELRRLRRDMQIIFQDPYSSLNPRMTVEGIVGEALAVHGIARGAEKRRRVGELLERCGLPARVMGRYPHEFSGGQRQRVGIARALALEPEFIVCDEAVSALDVSIQAQVINLLMDIQQDMGLSYLFIAHDLSVVEHISHRVAVMYLGRIVEIAGAAELYELPLHPYTRALLSAVPVPDPEHRHERIILEGDVPTPIDPPSGCPFHPRCWLAEARCSREVPALRDLGGDHAVACHLVDAASRTLRKDGKVLPPRAGKNGRDALPTVEAESSLSLEGAADAPRPAAARAIDAALGVLDVDEEDPADAALAAADAALAAADAALAETSTDQAEALAQTLPPPSPEVDGDAPTVPPPGTSSIDAALAAADEAADAALAAADAALGSAEDAAPPPAAQDDPEAARESESADPSDPGGSDAPPARPS